MGILALPYDSDPHYQVLCDYLSTENGFWIQNDIWMGYDEAFVETGIEINKRIQNATIADFSYFESERLKNEMKYCILWRLKEHSVSIVTCANYVKAMRILGRLLKNKKVVSFRDMTRNELGFIGEPINESNHIIIYRLFNTAIELIQELYDDRTELEKDRWHAILIPGVKLSAAAKRQKPAMSFVEVPSYYKDSIKRYMRTLIYRRSWSFCTEVLVYIRYFYKSFYNHGYEDGFQEVLTRNDIEKYLGWVAENHDSHNATFKSKAVSFIRNWLEFIQLAEFETAPAKDVTRLIFEDDIPRREHKSDTLEKVKYIPEPIRVALDVAIDEITPVEMKPVYILLRETGWRGTDILNLRYHQCLDYVWNNQRNEYVPYLYDEITKTGIPLHKIPIRPEVAEMVSALIREVKMKSTDENNPDKYLFNTYEGQYKGLPYSKSAFAYAVQNLINKKGIRDGKGDIYHFKTHSLRHTRAMEYTEQGMPIGIIQQILGHCSLQMTLHYSKVSEDMLYKKWQETEKLDLFKPSISTLNQEGVHAEEVHYELVRKNLDAVRVPFGTCFKPSKIGCNNQMRMCLECTSFCSNQEDLPAYDAEIKRVEELITIGKLVNRKEWIEKNQSYLEILEGMKQRILQEGIVHKNGKLREDVNG